MNNYWEIIAKSEPRTSLVKHINDCLKIANCLKKSFPAVTQIVNNDFWNLLELCIIFHDLGKSHKEFQNLLNEIPNEWKGNRHEIFSLPFIEGLNTNEELKQVIRLVVAGHHKSFSDLYDKLKNKFYPEDPEIWESYGVEPNTFQKDFFKYIPSNLVETLLLTEHKIKLVNISEVKDPAKLLRNYLRKPYSLNDKDFFLLLLLFGALKQSDHLGSAYIEDIPNLEIPDFRIKEKGFTFHYHQLEASAVLGNIIVNAPTGSGKTETALLWLESQIIKTGQGRIFYVLPFTASINAMYERLQVDLGKEKVGLLHGKLSEYLNNYFEDLQYTAGRRMEIIKELKAQFRTVVTPVKVITPFQLLKHLFGLKEFEKGIFEWVGSYFIFDEIHAYDPGVFAQIIVFLEFVTKYLNAKVMIMTATMPTFLNKEIEKAIGQFQLVKANQELYENFIRHKVILKEGRLEESLEEILNELTENGKRVLIVCNTVKQAQEAYRYFINKNIQGILLHGYFNGTDRFTKEKLLKGDDVKLLIGTQSIEVSLDIDFDIIFTEPAPLDALIQRFGRVNRKRKKGICQCIVFKERNQSDKFIYQDAEIIKRTLDVLGTIEVQNEGVIKEQELQNYIDFVYPDWGAASKEKFNLVYYNLSKMITELCPFIFSKEKEEDYYKQFDGLLVLPVSLESKYIEFMEEGNFIDAESLMVKIKSWMFASWLNPNNDNLKKKSFIKIKDGKILYEGYYYVTNKKYDSELGLNKDESEDWNNFINVDDQFK